jgi:Na+/H+ antiporter NhaC
MKALIKVLNWIEWISGILGCVMVLLGSISILMARSIISRFTTHIEEWFYIANSFFLLTIVLFLFIHFGQHKKE